MAVIIFCGLPKVETLMSPDAKPSFVKTYRIEEFKAARIEIERHLIGMRTLERQILIGDATLYAALLFRDGHATDQSLLNLAWWLPPFIGLLAGSLWRDSSEMVGRLGAYIRLNEPGGQGWEHFLLAQRRSRWPWVRFAWNILYWMMTIGGTAAVACFETTRRVAFTIPIGLCFSLMAIALALQVAPGERIKPPPS